MEEFAKQMRDVLVGRAETLLARRSGKNMRPFFIELTGSPSSGKSTIKKILDTFFRRREYRVAVPVEGAEAIRHISRKTYLYNIRTGIYALGNLLDYSTDSRFDLVIFDRALADAFSWMEYWQRKSDIDANTRQMFQEFFTHSGWLRMIDASFIVLAEPDAVQIREEKINLTNEDGATTNPETIASLIDIYRKTHEHFSPDCPLHVVDTTKLSKKKMAFQVLEHALDSFERRTS